MNLDKIKRFIKKIFIGQIVGMIIFISCDNKKPDSSIVGFWVSNISPTQNERVFLFNSDSTMFDGTHLHGKWTIRDETITIVYTKQDYYENFIDTLTYGFNLISSNDLEFYIDYIKESNLNNSENKSGILNLVVTDTIQLSRVSKQDKPFNESIVGEWNHIINNRELIIQKDGQIYAHFLKPSNKERHNYESFKWSAQWSNTYYSNSGRYVINTDSSLTITFNGTTTRKEEYALSRGLGYNPTETRNLWKNNTSTVKILKIRNVFKNYLITDVGVFKKESSG